MGLGTINGTIPKARVDGSYGPMHNTEIGSQKMVAQAQQVWEDTKQKKKGTTCM